MLARASLRISAATIDPELVVVGGGYAPAGDVLLEPLHRHLAELCLFTPRIEASSFGDQSVALGAVRLALDYVEKQFFSIEAPIPNGTGQEQEPSRDADANPTRSR